MDITHIRFGFATNSSSTHNCILPGGEVRTTEWKEFGWDNWTAADQESKTNWLAAVLYAHFRPLGDLADVLVQALLSVCFPMRDFSREVYIDHQSLPTLPREWHGYSPRFPWNGIPGSHGGFATLDLEFFKDFKEFILSDQVALIGGNDNEYTDHPLANLPTVEWFTDLLEKAPLQAKKVGLKRWVLFSPIAGTRLDIAFPGAPKTFVRTTPDLIDIKITDCCSFGCPFCYQGSTPQGAHAQKDIYAVARRLADAKVFEVAIGGGDPMEHPDFWPILCTFRSFGVTPNFSTRSIRWLRDIERRNAWISCGGGIGFSVSGKKDIDPIQRAVTRYLSHEPEYTISYQYPRLGRIYLHVVMGTMSQDDLKYILQKAIYPIVLLGWKPTGRAAGQAPPHPYLEWLPDVLTQGIPFFQGRRHFMPAISVDTTLWEELGDSTLKKITYHFRLFDAGREGERSMYIDLVSGLAGPSSYMPEKLVPYDVQTESIESVFSRITT